MIYECFVEEVGELKHGIINGKLSEKSLTLFNEKMIKDPISITQNFFYDMYPEGMVDYVELKRIAINSIKSMSLENSEYLINFLKLRGL